MPTILVADDEPSLRRLVRATIEDSDHAVLEAGDGELAWALIQEHHPCVALLDVQMPGRSGLELARAIRATPELSSTHIVLLTAFAQQADKAAGLAAGADLYLTKPFSPLELIQTIEHLCTVNGMAWRPGLLFSRSGGRVRPQIPEPTRASARAK